jgi:hypothetical protein
MIWPITHPATCFNSLYAVLSHKTRVTSNGLADILNSEIYSWVGGEVMAEVGIGARGV